MSSNVIRGVFVFILFLFFYSTAVWSEYHGVFWNWKNEKVVSQCLKVWNRIKKVLQVWNKSFKALEIVLKGWILLFSLCKRYFVFEFSNLSVFSWCIILFARFKILSVFIWKPMLIYWAKKKKSPELLKLEFWKDESWFGNFCGHTLVLVLQVASLPGTYSQKFSNRKWNHFQLLFKTFFPLLKAWAAQTLFYPVSSVQTVLARKKNARLLQITTCCTCFALLTANKIIFHIWWSFHCSVMTGSAGVSCIQIYGYKP